MWYTGGVTCWHGSGGSPRAAFGRLCPSGGPPAMAPPGLLVSWARPGGAARPLRSLAPRPGAFLVGGRGCAGPRGVPPLRGRGRRIASLAAGTCRTTGRKRVTRGTQEGFLSFSIRSFQNFFKVLKTCSGWRKHFFDSLTAPSAPGFFLVLLGRSWYDMAVDLKKGPTSMEELF